MALVNHVQEVMACMAYISFVMNTSALTSPPPPLSTQKLMCYVYVEVQTWRLPPSARTSRRHGGSAVVAAADLLPFSFLESAAGPSAVRAAGRSGGCSGAVVSSPSVHSVAPQQPLLQHQVGQHTDGHLPLPLLSRSEDDDAGHWQPSFETERSCAVTAQPPAS